jgi:hypothetical protein
MHVLLPPPQGSRNPSLKFIHGLQYTTELVPVLPCQTFESQTTKHRNPVRGHCEEYEQIVDSVVERVATPMEMHHSAPVDCCSNSDTHIP